MLMVVIFTATILCDVTYLLAKGVCIFFFFSSRRRHTRYWRDWSSDVCSSDLTLVAQAPGAEREGVRVISGRTSETMRRLMRLIVTDGSGKGADVPGYFVGGKTGTALKVGPRGGYLEDKRVAAFTGAFPMNAPRYAFYVMVDEPKPNARSHGYATAGWVAAPAAGAVIRRVAPILGMVPESPERIPQIQQAISIPLHPARPPGTR